MMYDCDQYLAFSFWPLASKRCFELLCKITDFFAKRMNYDASKNTKLPENKA